jgi:phospholipid N-methyltransferase
LPPSTARTLKGPRRLARRSARRSPSPRWQFLRGFLKNPVMVGSIIPSSRILIEKMLSKVDWQNTKVFVEYGPGVGTFCQAVLDRLGPDATYIAIDTNREFVDYLSRQYVDPRFFPVLGSAADVRRIIADHGHDHADYVLSGLPFSTLPPGLGPKIAAETLGALVPGGAFLVYQFNPKVRDILETAFERIDQEFELINIPPCQLWWCWKD